MIFFQNSLLFFRLLFCENFESCIFTLSRLNETGKYEESSNRLKRLKRCICIIEIVERDSSWLSSGWLFDIFLTQWFITCILSTKWTIRKSRYLFNERSSDCKKSSFAYIKRICDYLMFKYLHVSRNLNFHIMQIIKLWYEDK